MITLYMSKAQPIVRNDPVKPAYISIEEEIEDMFDLEAAREFYAAEARMLVNVLFDTLPGGTIDALLVELMSRKVSLFRVRHPSPE